MTILERYKELKTRDPKMSDVDIAKELGIVWPAGPRKGQPSGVMLRHKLAQEMKR